MAALRRCLSEQSRSYGLCSVFRRFLNRLLFLLDGIIILIRPRLLILPKTRLLRRTTDALVSYILEVPSTTLIEMIGNGDLRNFFFFGKINKTGASLIFDYNINCTHLNIHMSLSNVFYWFDLNEKKEN